MNKELKRTTGTPDRGSVARVVSEIELAGLGDGELAYIKAMTTDEVHEMFPMIEDLPVSGTLYALHGADGTPIALTDSRDAALSHAMDDELKIAMLH